VCSAAGRPARAPAPIAFASFSPRSPASAPPEGQFNRIEFTIPSSALPPITGDNADVTFTIVLNVNAGTSGWLVDDLEIGE
jgi:hypothetical protein